MNRKLIFLFLVAILSSQVVNSGLLISVTAILNVLLGSLTLCRNTIAVVLQVGLGINIDALFGGIIFPAIQECQASFEQSALVVAGNIDISLYLAAQVVGLINLKLDAVVDVEVLAAVDLAITSINNAGNSCSNELLNLGIEVSVDVNAAIKACDRTAVTTLGSLTTATPAQLAACQTLFDNLITDCTNICNPSRAQQIYLQLLVEIKAAINALVKVCVAADINIDLIAELDVIINTCNTACNDVLNGLPNPITSGGGISVGICLLGICL